MTISESVPMDSDHAAPTTAPADNTSTARLHQAFSTLRESLSQTIVGQSALVERLLIALLADGHLLVEGAPGLAKTTAIRALASRLQADFARVQFTPDLLPADLTGTEVWRPQDGRFEFQPGPIFHPILLADEINRAPAKVQSALLEAMGERQVTVGRHTYPLPQLFLVMATQNPIEQEGTFPLPEAQLDRFLMHVRIGYPEADAEAEILRLARERARDTLQHTTEAVARLPIEDVFAARALVLDLHVAPQLERYLIELVLASRDAKRYDPQLARRIAWGASPRGSIALERCARARLAGRTRLRDARRRARDRAGRTAPPRAAQLRSHRRRLGRRPPGRGVDRRRAVAVNRQSATHAVAASAATPVGMAPRMAVNGNRSASAVISAAACAAPAKTAVASVGFSERAPWPTV